MRRKKIYEGKAKILYEGPERNTLVQYFKDDATAFNNKKKSIIPGKGVLNNFISELLMSRLSEINVPNHFIKRLNMSCLLYTSPSPRDPKSSRMPSSA